MAIEAGAFALEHSPIYSELSAKLAQEELLNLRAQSIDLTEGNSERNQAYLWSAYVLVNSIAELALNEIDPSGAASVLLREVQPEAIPKRISVAKLPENQLAFYKDLPQELEVGDEAVDMVEGQLMQHKSGFGEFKEPGDKQLIGIVTAMAHETGHAILDGVGVQIAKADSREAWRATKAYLQNHPEKAVSGNWITDYTTHEERAVVGFSTLVTDKVLDMLGYNEYQRSEYKRIMSSQVMVDGKIGANQIDHLFKVGPGRALHEMVDPNSSEWQQYNGLLGYAKGVSGEEVAAMFAELGQIKESGVAFRERPMTWYNRVATARELGRFELREMVHGLVAQRAERIGTDIAHDLDQHPVPSYAGHVSDGMFRPDHTVVLPVIGLARTRR